MADHGERDRNKGAEGETVNTTKYLSQDERDHLESTLRERLESDARNATMLLTALYSGARANELLGLTWNDIDLSTGEVRLATLKGGRPRAVVLPKYVRVALSALKLASPERPFSISYTRLVEIWHLYRPTRKPFKSLRHTFAQRCYLKTRDLRFTQRALGHRSIKNTMIYLEYEYSASEYKRMMGVR